jgi:uncharacterized membrane protein YbhN (UPF0104 family)
MLLAVLVYGALVGVRGWSKVEASLATYAWWTFAAACGLAFSNYVLRYLKWEYYLAVLDVRGVGKVDSFLTFLSGFVLTVTPGKVGEVFKSFVLEKTHGVAAIRTGPIVFAERVTDLIAIIALIALGSASFPGGALWASLGGGVVVALLVLVSWRSLSRGLLRAGARLPGPAGAAIGRAAPKINTIFDDLQRLTSARHLVGPTLLSIVAWGLEGVALYVILRGFEGAADTLSLAPVAFFYSTATLAGALVPVPGGLGVTEKILEEELYRLGGVQSGTATAAMLLVRFATLWFAVLVGFVAVGALRARHPALVGAAPTDASAGPEPTAPGATNAPEEPDRADRPAPDAPDAGSGERTSSGGALTPRDASASTAGPRAPARAVGTARARPRSAAS